MCYFGGIVFSGGIVFTSSNNDNIKRLSILKVIEFPPVVPYKNGIIVIIVMRGFCE